MVSNCILSSRRWEPRPPRSPALVSYVLLATKLPNACSSRRRYRLRRRTGTNLKTVVGPSGSVVLFIDEHGVYLFVLPDRIKQSFQHIEFVANFTFRGLRQIGVRHKAVQLPLCQ